MEEYVGNWRQKSNSSEVTTDRDKSRYRGNEPIRLDQQKNKIPSNIFKLDFFRK